jgi:hypothetical protein
LAVEAKIKSEGVKSAEVKTKTDPAKKGTTDPDLAAISDEI